MQKTLKKKPVGDGGGGRVQKGSMVLARYHVDKAVYRARVEDVEDDMISVRFIDYGNKGDNLASSDVYSWDTLLDKIPPQAVACTLFRTQTDTYTTEQVEAFTSLMKESSPMQMTVHHRLTSEEITVVNTGPDVVVTLRSKDGINILSKLGLLPSFKSVLTQENKQCGSSSSEDELTRLQYLSEENVERPDLPHPHQVPPPLHLDGEVLAQVCDDGPPSPLHSEFTRRAVEKVQWWLNRAESEEEKLSEEDYCEKRNEQEIPVYKEPEFVETENSRIKSNMLSKARKQLYEEDGSLQSGSFLVTSRPKKISKQSVTPCAAPATVFPSVDVREGMAPAPLYSPPTIPRQEIEVG